MKHLLPLIPGLLLLSCDRPACKNDNLVLQHYSPESNEYKAELIRQLKKTSSERITYWIDRYTQTDTGEYMNIYVQGGDLCAKAVLDITNCDRLGNYKRVKGASYRGAGLMGLKYRIDSTGGHYNFIFEEVAHIPD